MPLIFKDSVQPPGDPDDQAGEQEGKCIRSEEAETGLKVRPQNEGRESAAKLHQQQRADAEAHAQDRVKAYTLPAEELQRHKRKK